MRRSLGLLTTLVLSAYLSIACAAAIQIDPVHLHLSQQRKITSILLRNNSKQPVTLQLHISRWWQHNGKNIDRRSRDLLVTPPLITLKPHHQQIFRVGMLQPLVKANEQTYRLYIREVPHYKPHNRPQLAIDLQVVLPIFIKPSHAVIHQSQWRIRRINAHLIKLTLKNQGNMHIQLSKITLTNKNTKTAFFKQKIFAYILAGQSRSWQFKVKQRIPAKPAIHITAESNWGKLTKL